MDFSKLTDYLDRIGECGIPARHMIVYRNGEPIYDHTAGFADEAHTKPVSGKDIYWFYSVTKVVTCVAALQLVEQRKIGLDDAVSKYLPEYADLSVLKKDGTVVKAENTMTVRHLFTMTGGLSYDIRMKPIADLLAENPNAATRELVAEFVKKPLLFEPGTSYSYGLCHDVLAAVIEVASGMKFSEYLNKYIFDPLGMKSMCFHPTEEQIENDMSDLYYHDRGLFKAVKKDKNNDFVLSPRYESGGAGLCGRAEDYAKFAGAMANSGVSSDGYRLLKADTVNMMKSVQLTEPVQRAYMFTVGKPGYSYGLGVRTHVNKLISMSRSPLGEFGWCGAASSYTMIDTDNKLAIFFAAHVVGCPYAEQTVQPHLRDLTYDALGL